MKETINNVWCFHCGSQDWMKRGFTPDRRQRLRCKVCGKSTTLNACMPGEKRFKEEKLLPCLRKHPCSLTDAELYCMGVLMADGSRKGSGNIDNMCLSITTSDRQLVEIVKRELHFPNEIKDYQRTREGGRIEAYSEIAWSNKWAGSYWDSLGLVRHKTGNEKWLPYMDSWHFVRGFLDGDGCIYSKHGRIEFYSASEIFLWNLHAFIEQHLSSGNKRKCYKKNKGAGDWYQLYYAGNDAKRIGALMYQDSEGLRLERKYKKYLEIS